MHPQSHLGHYIAQDKKGYRVYMFLISAQKHVVPGIRKVLIWISGVMNYACSTCHRLFVNKLNDVLKQRSCEGGVFGDNSGIIFLISP